MPQTLLVVLAMMLTMLFSINVQEHNVHSQHKMVKSEVELMAAGVASQMMSWIEAQAFDEATVDPAVYGGAPDSPEDLKGGDPGHGFGPEEGTGEVCTDLFQSTAAHCDDVDDFHGMAPAEVTFEANGVEVDFAIVDVQVEYVDISSDGAPDGEKTFQKEVTVFVQDVGMDSGRPVLPQPIRLTRVITYQP